MNTQLDDFYNHLNEAVITTNDFNEGTKFRKREKVAQYSYCGLNQKYRRYLSLDLDHAGSAFHFEAVNLPTPTIITVNPANTHCHYLYYLKTPVAYHPKSRRAPQDYFEAVQDALEIRLNADKAYNHTITKNPLHPRWHTQTYPTSYDLSDFTEYIDLPQRGLKSQLSGDIVVHGRNDELFHTLRLWAYRAVHTHQDDGRWEKAVQAQASDINARFVIPLPPPEVKATAKSVARWTWEHRQGVGKCRAKVLQFGTETAKERMSLGAGYTNTLRRKKTLEALQQAAHELSLVHGENIGASLLVKHTGMNIKTVRKYLPQI